MYRRTVISLLADFSSETSETRRPFKCFKCWRESFQAKLYIQLNYLSKQREKINIFRNMKTEYSFPADLQLTSTKPKSSSCKEQPVKETELHKGRKSPGKEEFAAG